MKKNILLLICTVLLSIIFYACSNNAGTNVVTNDDTAKTTDSIVAIRDSSLMKRTAVVYTCEMHPEVISDKPGKCPKCGMDLVKKQNLVKGSTLKGIKRDSATH